MSQPQFDDKDNQRGGNDAVVADLIESEHFPKLNCMTQLGNHVLSNNLIYSRFWPVTHWCFFYPPHQRAHTRYGPHTQSRRRSIPYCYSKVPCKSHNGPRPMLTCVDVEWEQSSSRIQPQHE